MLSSIQGTTNYQNSRPNFGNLSSGLTEELIKAAKSKNGSCTLQQVRELAELASDNMLGWHTGKDLTSEGQRAVGSFNTSKRSFCLPMQPLKEEQGMNLFTATQKVVQDMTSRWEEKLAAIRARLSQAPENTEQMEQKIRDMARTIPDRW